VLYPIRPSNDLSIQAVTHNTLQASMAPSSIVYDAEATHRRPPHALPIALRTRRAQLTKTPRPGTRSSP